MNYLKFCMEEILVEVQQQKKEEEFFYKYIQYLLKGFKKYKPHLKFKKTYFEKDMVYIQKFITKLINDLPQDTDALSFEEKHFLTRYQEFLSNMPNHPTPFIMDLMERIFPHKNETITYECPWRVPFSFYPEEEQNEFLHTKNTGTIVKCKVFICLEEAIKDFLYLNINPFMIHSDNQTFISIKKLDNLLAKIAKWYEIELSALFFESLRIRYYAHELNRSTIS